MYTRRSFGLVCIDSQYSTQQTVHLSVRKQITDQKLFSYSLHQNRERNPIVQEMQRPRVQTIIDQMAAILLKVIKVHILEVAGGTGRVGCSEVDLKPFYILRVLALRVGLGRHGHDIFKCTSQGSNHVCSFQVHTYMCVNSDSRMSCQPQCTTIWCQPCRANYVV